MKVIKFLTAAAASSAVLLGCQSSASQAEIPTENLIGEWKTVTTRGTKETLAFSADHTYVQVSEILGPEADESEEGANPFIVETGTFSVDRDHISFSPAEIRDAGTNSDRKTDPYSWQAAVSEDGTLKLIDPETGKEVFAYEKQ